MMSHEMGLLAKGKDMDNTPPDEAARGHIQQIKEDLQERIAYHMAQYEKLMHLAKQHEYAAQQYQILATAGEPVPAEGHSLRETLGY